MALTLAQLEELCLQQARELQTGEVSRERLIDAATSLLLIAGRMDELAARYHVVGLEDDVTGHGIAGLEDDQDGEGAALREALELLRSLSAERPNIRDAGLHTRVMTANRDLLRVIDWLKGMQNYQPLRDVLRRYDRGGTLNPSTR